MAGMRVCKFSMNHGAGLLGFAQVGNSRFTGMIEQFSLVFD